MSFIPTENHGKMKSRYSEEKNPTNYTVQRKPSEYAWKFFCLVFVAFFFSFFFLFLFCGLKYTRKIRML